MKEWVEECDLLVAGSGAAGLSAAVAAAHHGLRVIVVEKEPLFGGTTAWSGGWIWAPCNPVVKQHGVIEESSQPRRYLAALLGNNFNEDLVDAFLEAAPEMVEFFQTNTELQFEPGLKIPDTYGELPGAGMGGRSVIARPYDGRALDKQIKLLRPPKRETALFGMTIQAGPDLRAFMTATRSLGSSLYVVRRLASHCKDLLFHGRGMQLRNGSALVARLMRSALDMGVDLRSSRELVEFITGRNGVEGAVIASGSTQFAIRARRGVVLACGGYPHDQNRRKKTFPPMEHNLSLAVPSATGDGIRLGESVGGRQDLSLKSPGAWCPVSEVIWPDGNRGVFPHIIDRGKPGVIGVLANGKRFCNEGLGYHDYVREMLAANDGESEDLSWLICDHRFLRRYGLGIVRPTPFSFKPWLKTGYLASGKTVTDLAKACGIDPDALGSTISEYNQNAVRGEDPQFGRGTTAYMRLQGDPDNKPNPCIAPILKPPFYAVKVVPGNFGTFAGLKTDGFARVLGKNDKAINGLYAAGTDMASVMGGYYPAGGINLGPALTFGFIAGRHAALGGAE